MAGRETDHVVHKAGSSSPVEGTRSRAVIDLTGTTPTPAWPTTRGHRTGYLVAKRTLDLAVSVLIMLLFSPVFLLVAAAVAVSSPGPIFFRQRRIGRHGKAFVMLKFRTMVCGADEGIHRAHHEELARGNGEGTLQIEHDPRVTPLGRFLRRWSLDELPNLWSVLKGDMSLVGPRPLVPYEVALHTAEQLRRLEVKPGITGLAQVRGRLWHTLEERAVHDLEYVERCSLPYDLWLLARTIPALVTRPGV